MTDKTLASIDFFEIPVYRTRPSKYYKEQGELREQAINPEKKFTAYELETIWSPMKDEAKKELIDLWTYRFESSDKALPWKYNEIIGFIKLYATFELIKGEYYTADIKRLRKDRKRVPIRYWDKVLEIRISAKDSNAQIAQRLIMGLQNLQSESLFKNRFIRVEMLKVLIDFIDWKRLLPIGRS